MTLWDPGEIARLAVALLLIVVSARLLGALAAKLSLPALLGELLAGVVLGPTCLGAFELPGWASLFPGEGPRAEFLDLLTRLALLIFLIGAGVEVELDRISRHWRVALAVSAAGIAIPFALGFGAGVFDPAAVGWEGGSDPFHFALFFGTSLAITALPVIARTLMELNLYRSDLGMIVMSAAVLDDLVGWILFGLVVALALTPAESELPIPARLLLTLAFTAAVLSLGRRLNLAALHALARRTPRSAPVLAHVLGVGLLAAGCSTALGAGPMLGAFLAGAAASGSAAEDHRVFARLRGLVGKLCAPLFFGSIGLRVDFATNFEPSLVATVLALACAGKILGCGGAALASRTPPREAWALGFAMNSRGAMEIALALQALRYGLAGPRLFVALVVMAFVTSALAVFALRVLVGRRPKRRLLDHLRAEGFVTELIAGDAEAAIRTLAEAAASGSGVDAAVLAEAVIRRERLAPTGGGEEVAVPHARIKGLAAPVIALGVSRGGVDFGGPDGTLARIIVLIATPDPDAGVQVELLADARALRSPSLRERVMRAASFSELRAALQGS